MSLLGIYRKQPVEIEIYGIQFATDMAATDQISSAWTMIARDAAPSWDRIVQSAPYTALLTDDTRRIVSVSDVALPSGAEDGYHLNVANQSQNSGIFVGAFSVPARGSVVVVRVDGEWVEEAKTSAVLVDAVGDQRVRTKVSGGAPFESYRIDVTVDTSEGRVMQDEFIVEIEEE